MSALAGARALAEEVAAWHRPWARHRLELWGLVASGMWTLLWLVASLRWSRMHAGSEVLAWVPPSIRATGAPPGDFGAIDGATCLFLGSVALLGVLLVLAPLWFRIRHRQLVEVDSQRLRTFARPGDAHAALAVWLLRRHRAAARIRLDVWGPLVVATGVVLTGLQLARVCAPAPEACGLWWNALTRLDGGLFGTASVPMARALAYRVWGGLAGMLFCAGLHGTYRRIRALEAARAAPAPPAT